MPTVTLDLLQNSRVRIGDGYTQSFAIRNVLVEGLSAADVKAKIDEAETAIFTAIGGDGGVHPTYSWMPLASLEGGLIGTKKYRGRLTYRTRSFRFFSSPGVVNAVARGTEWTTEWYSSPGTTASPTFDSFGRPNGDPVKDDDDNFVKKYVVWRAIKFFVPFQLSSAPSASIGDLTGTTNTSVISSGNGPLGWGFGIGSLRFDGMSEVKQITNQGTTQFVGWYEFTAQRGLFAREYVEDGEVKMGFVYPGGWSSMASFPTS